MPRTITIHPASLAAGIALAGLCFLSMSQATVTTPLRVEYLAHPRDMVQIAGNQPYSVPAGKLFVLTAIGSTNQFGSGCTIHFSVNGVPELQSSVLIGTESITMKPIPPGFTVAAGSTITMASDTGCVSYEPWMRAWGYLVSM